MPAARTALTVQTMIEVRFNGLTEQNSGDGKLGLAALATRPRLIGLRYSPFLAALAPSFMASASLMYLPFFVLP